MGPGGKAPDVKRRTLVTARAGKALWSHVEAWAKQHDFRGAAAGDDRIFQKGSGIWSAPSRVQITKRDATVEIQAWIHVPMVTRVLSLFLMPGELPIGSGGFRALLPRTIARNAVNELLATLAAPPIE